MKYDRKKVEAAITEASWTGDEGSYEQTQAMILAALDAIFTEPPLRYPVTAEMVAAERDANGGTMMEAKERCYKAARGE
jgi:hypothetical protein